jgi:hypothetical protein
METTLRLEILDPISSREIPSRGLYVETFEFFIHDKEFVSDVTLSAKQQYCYARVYGNGSLLDEVWQYGVAKQTRRAKTFMPLVPEGPQRANLRSLVSRYQRIRIEYYFEEEASEPKLYAELQKGGKMEETQFFLEL